MNWRDTITGMFTKSRDPATTVAERPSTNREALRDALLAARSAHLPIDRYEILERAIVKALIRR